MQISAVPRDIESTSIAGSLNGLLNVYNYTVASGQWFPITIMAAETKQILLQCRSPIIWYLATVSGGPFWTVGAGGIIKAPIVTTSGNTLCWVNPSQNAVYEVIVGY